MVKPVALRADRGRGGAELALGGAELTLGDLVHNDQLGLETVVAPEGWAGRPVTGAHSIEIEHPAPWLDRDWIMLKILRHVSEDPAAQRELIDELADGHIAALGLGLNVVRRKIPAALIERATARSLPVFTIPARIAFRDLIGLVYRATLSNEIRVANRLAAMQRFLMDSLGEESPRATVVQRLSELLDAAVAILNPQGDAMLSSKALPGADIIAEVGKRPGATVHFELEDLHGLAFPIASSAAEMRWMVIASPVGKPLHPLAKAAGQTTVPLLAAMARLERAQQSEDAAVRRATLEAFLDLEDKRDASVVAARASASGVNIAQGATVIVVEESALNADLDSLLTTIGASLTNAQISSMATIREGRVVLIVGPRGREETAAERVATLRPTLWLGVGRRVTEPLEVRQSYADALLAVRVRTRGPRKWGNVIHYDNLDLGTVLVHEVPRERLAPKIDRWLAPLLENPLVHDALVAWLRYDLDVQRTAHVLHLHPNSVRYRLSRAEELLGVHLRSSETIVALHVALFSAGMDQG